ncbi:hypothetical protein TNCV_2067951 [Trichonephila clavipes]|uniref:Uncharacterized protein n=1 Tax=Trichonephila clavipes TaxID=2585209 RepID=A0A8X6W2Z1_TRICX|nr:hypothetical protein TNCV_2067951 [Trichonephila clavipes]
MKKRLKKSDRVWDKIPYTFVPIYDVSSRARNSCYVFPLLKFSPIKAEKERVKKSGAGDGRNALRYAHPVLV